MPAPSDSPKPSASSENAMQRPLADSAPIRPKPMKTSGVGITTAPPASAIVHSPVRSAWAARCRETSDDEHAVSTVTAGPSSPNV